MDTQIATLRSHSPFSPANHTSAFQQNLSPQHGSAPDRTSAIMKTFQTLFIAGAGLFVASQAYIVELWENTDCTGSSTSRNVYDNTCAYTEGFQSLQLTTQGGALQQLIAYSPQACAGEQTFTGCAAGVDSLVIGQCHQTTNSNGGSNALSSYSSGGVCPN